MGKSIFKNLYDYFQKKIIKSKKFSEYEISGANQSCSYIFDRIIEDAFFKKCKTCGETDKQVIDNSVRCSKCDNVFLLKTLTR